jgi:hypothetical protein
MAGSGISEVKPSGSATIEHSNTTHKETNSRLATEMTNHLQLGSTRDYTTNE